jgi:hypothetical protein
MSKIKCLDKMSLRNVFKKCDRQRERGERERAREKYCGIGM